MLVERIEFEKASAERRRLVGTAAEEARLVPYPGILGQLLPGVLGEGIDQPVSGLVAGPCGHHRGGAPHRRQRALRSRGREGRCQRLLLSSGGSNE